MGSAPEGPIPVVVMGLGAIGQQIARAAIASEELRLVGAVDSHQSLKGKKLGEVLGGGALASVRVSAGLEDALAKRKGAVVLHATSSRLPQVMDQLLEAIGHGCSVVSTCEELAFPYLKHGEL